MSIIIDFILIIIGVSAVITGYKNGLMKTVLSFARSIVALIVAYAFTPYLSSVFYDSFILGRIADGIEKTVDSLSLNGGEYDFQKLLEDAPKVLSQMLDKYDVSFESLNTFVSGMTETGEAAVRQISEFISSPVATVISNALAFIIIYAVVYFALFIVSKLIEAIFKAPILKTADKVGGLALGVVNGLFVLWVLSMVLSFAVTALGSVAPDWFGASVVENSFVFQFFSKINPLQILSNVVEHKVK